MHHTRLSLFYLAGYLFPTGILLVAAPDLLFKLLLSTGQYGDVIPRLAGGLILALGILVAQIIRHRLEVLYSTTVVIRFMLLAVLGWLYVHTRDPFFIVVSGVVGLGMLLTGGALLMAMRQPPGASQTPAPR